MKHEGLLHIISGMRPSGKLLSKAHQDHQIGVSKETLLGRNRAGSVLETIKLGWKR